MLQCSVPKENLHCHCILTIFPARVHQFYANIFVFLNINPFLYINDQFGLRNIFEKIPRDKVKVHFYRLGIAKIGAQMFTLIFYS